MDSTSISRQRRRDIHALASARLEPLEGRTLFAGTPLYLTETVTARGPELFIDGSPGDDRISLVAYEDTLTLANKGGWSIILPNHFAVIHINAAKGHDLVIVDGSVMTGTILRGSNGDDTIMGGSGDDRIYGGYGRDRILGGAGDDTIVTIGDSVQDRVSGGDGFDSFWVDVQRSEVITDGSPEELAAGAMHRVGSFYSPPVVGVEPLSDAMVTASRDLGGQDLPDPAPVQATSPFADFSDRPLFSTAGPVPTDIRQGAVGDCYLLASLSAVALQNPDLLRQSIVELGDGTYGVRYHRDGAPVYVRVDADLPVGSFGDMAYAALGAQQSLWVALMEKAYAMFRTGAGTYASIGGGWMTEVFDALDAPSTTIWLDTTITPGDVLAHLKVELDAGAAVTWATWKIPSGVPLVGLHAYAVESVALDAVGIAVSVTLRNPWGYDGGGNHDGVNDGLVTLTLAQAANAFSAIMYARV